MRWLACLMVIAACHADDWLQYRWDHRRVVCSQVLDDLLGRGSWDDIAGQLELARDHEAVTFVHTHAPGQTVSIAALERLFDAVEAHGLDYVTFPELVPGAARGGLALAFDDAHVDLWHDLRPLLADRGVRATFFITRIHLFDAAQLGKLADLAADGHAIEAHAVDHLDAKEYVCEHGARRYLDHEGLPSITRLRDLGYRVSAFAFPFGRDHRDLYGPLHREVNMVRVGPAACPY